MSNVLCRWLNEELRLSQVVEPKSFAKAFSSGYLLGEILHKYQLQSDFHMFMKKERSISKLYNFTRLEPSLHLLGIPFTANTAQELMLERQEVAEHLVQQLYNSLETKRVAVISGPEKSAASSLRKKEHDICKVMNHQKMSKPDENKLQVDRSSIASAVQQKKSQIKQEDKSKRSADTISTVEAPKPPPHLSQLKLKKQRQQKLAQDVQNEIAQFESIRGKMHSSSLRNLGSSKSLPNNVYMQQIQQRFKEHALAREQRDKRVSRFLLEQARAREAEQYAKHEEYLLRRFTRSTKQEQRLTAQLHQIRKHKEVITNNRLFREQQIQQMRDKDFQEAERRKAVLAEQAKMAFAEEIKWNLDICKRLAAAQDENTYQEHGEFCKEIVEDIVDLGTKVGEYCLASGNPVPEKQMNEWKEILISGLPLFEPSNVGELECSLDPVELKKQDLLNNLVYEEYVNMTGEWVWPEEEKKLPSTNNNILGHMVAQLRTVEHRNAPREKPAESLFPYFTLKACILGKMCSGKTSCLTKIAKAHGIHVLSIQELVREAVNAHKIGEALQATEKEQEPTDRGKEPTGESNDLSQDAASIKLSTQVMNGQEAEKLMVEGYCLPFEFLLKTVLEAIRNIPANSGWILDGFPLNVRQAHLLEEALGGSVEDEQCIVTNSQTNLAVDPDPPKPPPPPPPALDVALLLHISDECAITRALNLAYTSTADATHDYVYMSQIPYRITEFNKTLPNLERWFEGKQKILIRIDANVDEEELFNRVEAALLRPFSEVVITFADEVGMSDKRTHPNILSGRPSFHHSPKHKPKSTESRNRAENNTKKEEIARMSTENLGESTTHNAPHNDEKRPTLWDEPLPPDILEALYIHWKNVCEMYVNNVKSVLKELRRENTLVNEHFVNIKKEFENFLDRPDLRQEVVCHWQKNFNSVADDMRDDEETKAELHLRLQELCEQLWNISEQRKQENEQERAAFLGDGWLSDHIALLVNYHSILIQVELDRFQDTYCILKKYYLKITSNPNPATISLLDTSIRPALETESKQSEQDQPQKKLLDDYEEAIKAINSLLPVEAEKMEVEAKPTDKAQEKPPGADKSTKKTHYDAPSPLPAPSPEPHEHIPIEECRTSVEYSAALSHEEKAAKVRIALVKGRALNSLDLIQQKIDQTSYWMEKWFNKNYEKEMKSIEDLAKVIQPHIESGDKLLNELVLDCNHFCLNGDYHMVALPPPPSRPPSFEKTSQITFSIIQLESLCQQFRCIAPNGCLSCLEFYSFFKDMLTTYKGRNILPEAWVSMTETQLMEIVASIKDKHGFVDWRRFLLGCALPWPLPSVMQLLEALQHFKAADIEEKGYVFEEQYLQTQLWFSKETVVKPPEDLSKPLPYNRLLNLFKFFFQLFADHSVSPSRLNYTSMLLYLSADLYTKQGFIRALSVAVGHHLRQTSSPRLLQRPSLDKVPEFSSSEVDVDCSRSLRSSSNVLFGNQKVSIAALLTVLGHSSTTENSQSKYTKLVGVYKELGYEPDDSIAFSILATHLSIQHLMEKSTQHQLVNFSHILNNGEYAK